MPDPLTFTLKVPAVMIIGIPLATKLCRVVLCVLGDTLLRQVMVGRFTRPSALASVLAAPWAV